MLTRWEPFREMRRLTDILDRWMEESFLSPAFEGLYEGIVPVDVYQTDNDVVVKAVLPGVRPEDIHISITGDNLVIRGEVREEIGTNGGGDRQYHIRERRYGRFSRSLILPTMVDADKAKAEFENGILTLTLPKAEEVRPKTITVKAKK